MNLRLANENLFVVGEIAEFHFLFLFSSQMTNKKHDLVEKAYTMLPFCALQQIRFLKMK